MEDALCERIQPALADSAEDRHVWRSCQEDFVAWPAARFPPDAMLRLPAHHHRGVAREGWDIRAPPLCRAAGTVVRQRSSLLLVSRSHLTRMSSPSAVAHRVRAQGEKKTPDPANLQRRREGGGREAVVSGHPRERRSPDMDLDESLSAGMARRD